MNISIQVDKLNGELIIFLNLNLLILSYSYVNCVRLRVVFPSCNQFSARMEF